MHVIDAQVHLNTEIGIEASLFAMDAVGIDAVLIDEWNGFDSNGMSKPYRFLPNGAFRCEYPMAREAARRYPGRFAYMGKVDRNDPELVDVLADIGANPHQLCLRVSPKAALGQVAAMEAGEYDVLFGAAEKHEIPIMIWLPGRLDVLKKVAERYAGLQLILDHCGLLPVPVDVPRPVDYDALVAEVCETAAHENVAIKLSHAPVISSEPYPFPDLVAHIRRIVDHFGADRVMWASDHTQTKWYHTWAQALHYLPASGRFSSPELDAILGGTALKLLKWPMSPAFGRYHTNEFHRVEPTAR